MALLEANGLSLSYETDRGLVRAVDGVSFHVEPGQSVGIIGETGSGKTSLLYALSRMYPRNTAESDGSIHLNGRDISAMDEGTFRREIRWREMAIVFQAAMNGFNPVMRVGKQIAERAVLEGQTEAQLRPKVGRLLTSVGLPESVYGRFPHELSGGMKQRAAIAMALVLDPPLLILDEPTSALDVSVQAQIMNTLKKLKWELGLSMIFITHDIALASDLCDRLVVMYAGQVREEGSIHDVLTAPQDPYTQELLASIPRLAGGSEPRFVPGQAPDPTAFGAACRFHARCPHAFERCASEAPPLAPAAPDTGHSARCWLVHGGDPA